MPQRPSRPLPQMMAGHFRRCRRAARPAASRQTCCPRLLRAATRLIGALWSCQHRHSRRQRRRRQPWRCPAARVKPSQQRMQQVSRTWAEPPPSRSSNRVGCAVHRDRRQRQPRAGSCLAAVPVHLPRLLACAHFISRHFISCSNVAGRAAKPLPSPGPAAEAPQYAIAAPPPERLCWVQGATDFKGGDLGPGNSTCCQTAADCCNTCWDRPGCGAWTYRAADVSVGGGQCSGWVRAQRMRAGVCTGGNCGGNGGGPGAVVHCWSAQCTHTCCLSTPFECHRPPVSPRGRQAGCGPHASQASPPASSPLSL